MPKYRVAGAYKEYYELTIEAPDEDTAVQIFYQKGGGESSVDGDWDDIDVDFVSWSDPDTHEEPEADYTEKDYDPDGGKIRW